MTVKETLFQNESLAQYCSWRVGGPARRLFKPSDDAALIAFLKNLPENEPLLWLGLGSNTLIRDGGFSGTVIVTQGMKQDLSLGEDGSVEAGAGVACATFARFCARNNLKGAEFFAGIPGTMGGALRMNAGCFNGETWNFVERVTTVDRHGQLKTRLPSDFDIAYRHVDGLGDEWFLSARFQFEPGEKAESLKMIRELLDRRSATQPTGDYSCGSVFRNPPGDHAARLIESCGLKGFSIGDAMVSNKHANFFINRGQATASDLENLILTVQQEVNKQQGIQLQTEVKIIGEQ
jgi:UDP-N-acetylmuramate dehydrogenase